MSQSFYANACHRSPLDEAECELNCKPIGLNYYATLNERVIDGTNCLRPIESARLKYTGPAKCVEGVCKVKKPISFKQESNKYHTIYILWVFHLSFNKIFLSTCSLTRYSRYQHRLKLDSHFLTHCYWYYYDNCVCFMWNAMKRPTQSNVIKLRSLKHHKRTKRPTWLMWFHSSRANDLLFTKANCRGCYLLGYAYA